MDADPPTQGVKIARRMTALEGLGVIGLLHPPCSLCYSLLTASVQVRVREYVAFPHFPTACWRVSTTLGADAPTNEPCE